MGRNVTQIEEFLDGLDGDYAELERRIALRKRSTTPASAVAEYGEPLVLSVRHAKKTYRTRHTRVLAIDDVSLDVRMGEIVAITGPSGSGKSTILNLLSGLDQPDSGEIVVDGKDITQLSRNDLAAFRSARVGFVFQFFYLQPFLSVLQNVQVPLMFQHRLTMSRERRRKSARRLIEAVGLADRATHLPKELSGGQMQRVAIARALMNEPILLLADEPTGNLDSQNANGIMQLLEDLRRRHNTAVIVVTHDHEVAAYADRVIEMKDGRIHGVSAGILSLP